jgi:hypothetical protein
MTIDTVTESMSRRLGTRLSRRSFFGRLGAGLALAGGGSLALRTGVAFGEEFACCGCATCGYSSTCQTEGGACPSGTCACGSWLLCNCTGTRGMVMRRYRDCCAACTGGCFCGWDNKPRCYYPAPYATCNGHNKVRCRSIFCTTIRC